MTNLTFWDEPEVVQHDIPNNTLVFIKSGDIYIEGIIVNHSNSLYTIATSHGDSYNIDKSIKEIYVKINGEIGVNDNVMAKIENKNEFNLGIVHEIQVIGNKTLYNVRSTNSKKIYQTVVKVSLPPTTT